MKKILITFCLLLFFIFCGEINNISAAPSSVRETSSFTMSEDYTIYWVTTSDTITFAWDASVGADRYEVSIHWIRGDKVLQIYAIGNTADLEIQFNLPRSGAFVAAVRACKEDPENPGTYLCSDWAKSSDPNYAVVNGQAKAWILLGAIAAPGPIIVP